MAKKKISAKEYAEAHDQLVTALGNEFASKGKVLGRLLEGGPIAKRLSRRAYDDYLAAGGKAGDWKAFAQWLLENLPKILALLLPLFI